jgi:hypothetical protein
MRAILLSCVVIDSSFGRLHLGQLLHDHLLTECSGP